MLMKVTVTIQANVVIDVKEPGDATGCAERLIYDMQGDYGLTCGEFTVDNIEMEDSEQV